MKQLKPRDKITQKMTRDGAVEINETQQTAERISSREADSDFSQPDTATAERVMEHLDAAHTRKASKKAVKKAQEAAVLRTSTSRLQFTDEERETPKLQPYIKKSEKAADKLDAAKAALPTEIPSPAAIPFVNIVFPTPRSPISAKICPGFACAASFFPTSQVSCSECVSIIIVFSPFHRSALCKVDIHFAHLTRGMFILPSAFACSPALVR